MKTVVIFRKFRDGEIVALLPFVPFNHVFCTSYMHTGQHAAAYYWAVIRSTVPAKPEEFADLKAELLTMGYELDIKKKRPFQNRRRKS